MQDAKKTQRSQVTMLTNGCFRKRFFNRDARVRFATEVRVLLHLEMADCPFVPRLIEFDEESLSIVTSNCGQKVQYMPDPFVKALFDELQQFGIQHDDPELRNVTYDSHLGRFCVIDFEYSTFLPNWSPTAPLKRLDAKLEALDSLLIKLDEI